MADSTIRRWATWRSWSPGRLTLLAFVFVFAAGLRVSMVRNQPLWGDEFFSLAMATGHSLEHPASVAEPGLGDFVEHAQPVPPSVYARYLEHDRPAASLVRVLRAVRLSDTSPPLYYVLLWAWTRVLGTGDAALRLLSVLAALGAFALTATLARQACGSSAVLPTALLFAVSPMCLYYSTEGRMYALLWFWVAALLVLALGLRSDGPSVRRLIGWTLVGAGGLLTHYFFAPTWLAVVAWLLATPGRSRRGSLVGAAALSAALAAPWYVGIRESLAQWRVSGGWLNRVPAEHDHWRAPFEAAWSLVSVRAAWGLPLALDIVNGLTLFALLALAGRRLGWKALAPPGGLLWIAVAAGVGTPVLFDLLMGTYTTAFPRYALAVLPAALALLGGALAAVRTTPRALLASLLVLVALAGSWRVRRASSRNGAPVSYVSGFLAAQTRPSDVILVRAIPSAVCGVARYLERFTNGRPTGPFAAWVSQLGERKVPRDLERLMAGRSRLFLVTTHALGATAGEEAWLRREARLTSAQFAEAASVLVFEPRAGGAFRGEQSTAEDRR